MRSMHGHTRIRRNQPRGPILDSRLRAEIFQASCCAGYDTALLAEDGIVSVGANAG
jgi:hypothetical protein